MRLKVNPNRMELLRLRRRYALALRGHKMIKDKLDGLVKEFLPLARQYRDARVSADRELPQLLRPFLLARMGSIEGTVETALMQSTVGARCNVPLQITTTHWRILNVVLTRLEAKVPPAADYSLLDTPSELDTAIVALRDYLNKILTLAELEHAVRLLAKEVEETRRRVNALEYILLPELREAIKFIKAKLDEAERSHISRLLKIKEMFGSRGKELEG
ncbi:MAG TPA: V-type ATP synthase subunit D [Candidatus Tripitaka californicus]|uniref:V-type ATP synthase subunit D n=1 Tax=Candidatus Tripitaka californicus TaxID=3367616 RepID=UPI0040299A25|nr:V-type ATP synthase subunit D [Planctomycetota bacterium]